MIITFAVPISSKHSVNKSTFLNLSLDQPLMIIQPTYNYHRHALEREKQIMAFMPMTISSTLALQSRPTHFFIFYPRGCVTSKYSISNDKSLVRYECVARSVVKREDCSFLTILSARERESILLALIHLIQNYCFQQSRGQCSLCHTHTLPL